MAKLVEVIPSSFAGLPKRRMPALRVLLATSAAVAFLASLASPAEAQRRYRYFSPYYGFTDMFGTYAPRRATRSAVQSRKPEPQKDVGFGELPKGPLQIVVSIGSQRVTLFANGERVARGTGVDRRAGPSDAARRVQRDREGPPPPLQHLCRCADAVHAADHLVGHRAARGRAARPSGVARLHPAVERVRAGSSGRPPSSARA